MKLEITKGEWVINEDRSHSLETKIFCGLKRIAEAKHFNTGYDDWSKNDPIFKEGLANAILIADAGTTYNKCETLPSELLKQNEALVECLKLIYNTERLSSIIKCEIEELLNTLNK